MTYPIAEQFKQNILKKPLLKKDEFYKGGYHTMLKRLRQNLLPFPGAYNEFLSRSENLTYAEAVGLMWDYVGME